ncbi:MAG: hypothetical protein ACLFVX_09195 [Archaeoglobaceae archaeon]
MQCRCHGATGTGSVGGDERAMLVCFVNNLYEYEDPDEVRRPWDDETVVPKMVNGREDDGRVGRP